MGWLAPSLPEEEHEVTVGIRRGRSTAAEATALARSIGRSTPIFEGKHREVQPRGQGERKVVGTECRGNCMEFIMWGLVGLSKDFLWDAE